MFFIPAFIVIPLLITSMVFFASISIERAEQRKRKVLLILSIVANILPLAFFKYFNFLSANIGILARVFHWNPTLPSINIVLPLGLSFQTFQSLAYLIEVYRGNYKAEKHFGKLATYILFFPLQMAGPIERPGNLLHQLRGNYEFDYKRVTDGMKLMVWGFFKKLVIADRLAYLVNPVYDHPQNFTGPMLLIATIGFAYQIYCDFSGYTDIAIGAARVMGFNLLPNFRTPYNAKSISEFWQRWHISLSTWLRDYIFLPVTYSASRFLGDLKWFSGKPEYIGYVIGTISTMFIAGLWHGANYTFILWGLIMGFYMIIAILTRKIRAKMCRLSRLNKRRTLHGAIRIIITFSLICFAWIFFRANTIDDAFYVCSHLFSGFDLGQFEIISSQLLATLGTNLQLKIMLPSLTGFHVLGLMVVQIVLLELIQVVERRGNLIRKISLQKLWLRWSIYYAAILFILLFGVFEQSKFIYFQF
jgi:D-alanyl-lipoteichoic acid acyltransferase DltB (MBOAT superfamily)